MMEEENKIELSKNFILKAKRAFKEALALKNQELYEGASNRLYYAVFYAANAVLILKEISPRKHTGVKSLFSKEFVNKGLISERFGKIFKDVMIIRQDCDYNIFYVVDKSKVNRNFVEVEDFINNMEEFINKVINREITL